MSLNLGSKKLPLIVLLGVIGLIALYPWKSMVVPQWTVRIVDQSGTPLRHTGVREIWQHYDVESKGHEQDLLTDGEGYVTFPERWVRGPLAVRIGRRIISSLVPHRGAGPDAFVVVLAPEYDTLSNNSALPGQPVPTQIIVRKNR
jgi:hypothetical protein